MSNSPPVDPPAEGTTGEDRLELPLPDGRRLLVIVRYQYGATVVVVGPPKPPKGPVLLFPLDERVGITIETEVIASA